MADVTAVCCSLVSMILSDSNSLVALSMNVDAAFVIPFAVGTRAASSKLRSSSDTSACCTMRGSLIGLLMIVLLACSAPIPGAA